LQSLIDWCSTLAIFQLYRGVLVFEILKRGNIIQIRSLLFFSSPWGYTYIPYGITSGLIY